MSDKASGRTVGQGSTMLETLYGSLSGMAFGLVSPLASQPFDTLKTKMQAESRYAQQGMGTVLRQVLRAVCPTHRTLGGPEISAGCRIQGTFTTYRHDD